MILLHHLKIRLDGFSHGFYLTILYLNAPMTIIDFYIHIGKPRFSILFDGGKILFN